MVSGRWNLEINASSFTSDSNLACLIGLEPGKERVIFYGLVESDLEHVSHVRMGVMSTGKGVGMGEGYLQVTKTDHIGLQSLALTEKPLISLLNTMPPHSLTLTPNLHLERIMQLS
ncbi:unnamed protein product [Sphenostylis stenocarpa]|uniref:Uncharacterized protein n=1 Tax=Sphenostylis stenocarpa TaxID=92480 RepID=A0AA86VRF4_9FABA|nr:unnamed protein product [Sphenostylis stenocarpa]